MSPEAIEVLVSLGGVVLSAGVAYGVLRASTGFLKDILAEIKSDVKSLDTKVDGHHADTEREFKEVREQLHKQDRAIVALLVGNPAARKVAS